MNCPKCGAADFYASIFNGSRNCLSSACEYGPKPKPGVKTGYLGGDPSKPVTFVCLEEDDSGTELEILCRKVGIDIDYFWGAFKPCPDGTFPPQEWRVELSRVDDTNGTDFLETDFFGGGAASEPTAADVLYCLVSDTSSVEDASSFEEWCRDLGYDSDSRIAEAIFKSCERTAGEVRRFLGDHFDAFVLAEH